MSITPMSVLNIVKYLNDVRKILFILTPRYASLWHDRIEHGVFSKKLACLQPLARLPDTVRCAVFWGSESAAVHFPHQRHNQPLVPRKWPHLRLSAEQEAAKADLNRHLNTVRQQYQARKRAHRLHRERFGPRARELAP